MKKLISLSIFILFISCNSVKKASDHSKNEIHISNPRIEKKDFFPMFKRAVFMSSIQYSFNNSQEIKKLLTEDKSGDAAGELLDLEDVYRVAKMVAARIKQDSIKSIGHAGDLEGKTVFKTCLDFYISHELDFITKNLYKTKYSKPWTIGFAPDTVNKKR